MSGKMGNYPTTPCKSTKLKKLEYPLEVLQKNMELALSSTFFLELKVFGNVELEWSYKNGSGAVPNTPKFAHPS
jgi:hypothetical protein